MPCPRRGGPGVGELGDRDRVLRPPVAGRHRGRHRAIVRCRGPLSHPARTWPAGIDWDTVRALAADAGDTGPGQCGHLARVPAVDARDAAGLTLGHAGQAVRAARRAGASVRRPGHRARGGHAARRSGEPVGAAAGPAVQRAQIQDQLDRAIADARGAQGKRPTLPGDHPCRCVRARISRDACMRDDFRGRRASHLPDAVRQDVPWTMKGCLMEIINLGQADGLPPVDWAAVADKLAAGSAPAPDAVNSRTTWLSTLNEDGSPHVTAVGALWLDGTFWFQTGAGTRKGRNVARDRRCSIAVSIRDADVVIEGDAARVTEPGAVARIAKAWADNGWPAEPDDSGSGITAPFNAPSQGPPPWNVYRIEPRSAIVTLAAEPGGLTRFRF